MQPRVHRSTGLWSESAFRTVANNETTVFVITWNSGNMRVFRRIWHQTMSAIMEMRWGRAGLSSPCLVNDGHRLVGSNTDATYSPPTRFMCDRYVFAFETGVSDWVCTIKTMMMNSKQMVDRESCGRFQMTAEALCVVTRMHQTIYPRFKYINPTKSRGICSPIRWKAFILYLLREQRTEDTL